MVPVVQAPEQRVHQALHIGGAEAVVHHLADICGAIAVRVFEVQQLRRIGDKDTALPAGDGRRPFQLVDQRRERVEDAIAASSVRRRMLLKCSLRCSE
ncbi:MAG: hypothetical protein HC888_18450 [Candidatus Competibacteraceae bacterium]|nr:hypothetical protein [Candidatus Competibacteraceae bacterium]